MEELKRRLAEQKGRHQGGSKWIGTGGTSPFGAYGYNPAGVRIGQHESRHRRAIKVWDKREFKDLDDARELGTRNIKVALRRLRRFARQGAAEELDLDGTIRGTAHKGYLDLHLRPERRNAVKVLMFLDVGGSMDWHIREAEELFSAARSEFKHLEFYYFHNCLYEHVWKHNDRRWTDKTATWDVLHTYPADYKVIFVGDASMSPYEISVPGGAVEHMNEEPGAVWMTRVADIYQHCVWLNPVPEAHWDWTPSIGILRTLLGGPHVSADARGPRPRHARADALSGRGGALRIGPERASSRIGVTVSLCGAGVNILPAPRSRPHPGAPGAPPRSLPGRGAPLDQQARGDHPGATEPALCTRMRPPRSRSAQPGRFGIPRRFESGVRDPVVDDRKGAARRRPAPAPPSRAPARSATAAHESRPA